MVNVLIILVVSAIVGAAAGYIYVQKKRGTKCIGCPDSATCSGNCCGCGKN